MMEQGLAQQQAMQEQQMAQAQGQAPQVNEQMVTQVMALLEQGMSPEELLQRGVPMEVIEVAMQMLTQQATQIPEGEAGLAGMITQQGM